MVKMNKRKIVDQWIQKNGAASFDLKNRDIILYDGGLFSIEKKIVLRHSVKGFAKPIGGLSRVIFSKKKYPTEELEAVFWFGELDDTIKYFKSMKKMLNSLGYKTDYKKNLNIYKKDININKKKIQGDKNE